MAGNLIISREQLRAMRDLVNEFAKSSSAKVNWKKHLIRLSDACDTLDAVMARANIKEMELEGRKIKRVMDFPEGINKEQADYLNEKADEKKI